MDQYLASTRDEAEQDRVEDLLRPLACARGDGLPLDDAGLWPQLATALARPDRRYTAEDVARLLDTAATTSSMCSTCLLASVSPSPESTE
jgi:hypothetical protein